MTRGKYAVTEKLLKDIEQQTETLAGDSDLSIACAAFNTKFPTLEDLLTSPDGAGLTTATPLQRAICRIIDGQPLAELSDNADVAEALGISLAQLGKLKLVEHVPEIIIVAAVRCAKSLIASCVAIMATQRCILTGLLPGEIPRYPIVSVSVDNARVVIGHLLAILQRPAMRGLRIQQKSIAKWQEHWKELLDETTADDVVGNLFVWHPSGRPIEIRVVAGRRAGSSVISRWLIGLLLDEAPRMVGSSEGVVNYDDTRRGARTRLLPGAQILSIGSPWLPMGPVFSAVSKSFGQPNSQRVVIRARGDKLNPYWWTPERIAEIKVSDPIAYVTDYLAEFSDLGESLFTQKMLVECTRVDAEPIAWATGHDYAAAMDPATRNNAWTLVVGDRKGRVHRVVYAKQWQGTSSEPLRPHVVLKEIAEVLRGYRLNFCYTDQWSADAMLDLAMQFRLGLAIEDWTQMNKVEAFQSLRLGFEEKLVELPNDPMLLQDLRLTRRQGTAKGQVSIQFSRTPDGRHCDYSPPIARLMKKWLNDVALPRPDRGTPQELELRMVELEQKEAAKCDNAAKNPSEWWANEQVPPLGG